MNVEYAIAGDAISATAAVPTAMQAANLNAHRSLTDGTTCNSHSGTSGNMPIIIFGAIGSSKQIRTEP